MKVTTIFRYTLLCLLFVGQKFVQAQNQPASNYRVKGMIADSIDQKLSRYLY